MPTRDEIRLSRWNITHNAADHPCLTEQECAECRLQIRINGPMPSVAEIQAYRDRRAGLARKRAEWDALRKAVAPRIFERDGHKCVLCDPCTCPDPRLTIDHIRPLHEGGGNEDENLRTLCWSCNSKWRSRK